MKYLILIVLVFFTGFSQAQDLFQESLYSAELVMKHRDQINLTEQQSEKIKRIHSQSAGEFSALKWDLDAATAKLKSMLNERKLNESAIEKQMGVVLSLENSLKQKQLSTLVAIKNELNNQQQDELKKLKGQTTTIRGQASTKSSRENSSATMTITGTEQPNYFLQTRSGLKQIKDVSNLNPNDIEKVEVLKGETAIERMGVKEGKQGVVIIHLKEGKGNDLLK